MQVRDPVCGESIQLTEAVAAEEDGGWTYFFCSTVCHDRFSTAPARYTEERPLHRETLKASAGSGAGG